MFSHIFFSLRHCVFTGNYEGDGVVKSYTVSKQGVEKFSEKNFMRLCFVPRTKSFHMRIFQLMGLCITRQLLLFLKTV